MLAKVTKLKNGLKIVTEKRNFSNTTIAIAFKAGMLNETNELNGISHFLEHSLFLGTETKTSQQLVDEIEKLGGYTNAYTSLDHTVYLCNVLPENWKIGLEYLADITQHSIFPQEKVDKEREVVIQEIMRSEDDPVNCTFNVLGKAAYVDQALSRTILGPVENIRKFTREDLINYMKSGYTADNAVISVCGDIDHEEFVKEVEKLFTDLPEKCTLPRFKNVFIPSTKTEEKPINQAHVMIALEGVKTNDSLKELAICSVFKSVLDGGMSTRLFQNVREKHGLGYVVSMISDKVEDTGYMGVYVGVDKENVEKAIEVSKETLESMKQGIEDAEMEKAKNLCIYSLSSANDKVTRVCEGNMMNLLFRNEIIPYKKVCKAIKRVTKQDVIDFANKYITNNYATAIILPKEKEQNND